MPTIAVENSTWNNVGDAFYQLALQQTLAEALPQFAVFSIDGPTSRAFRPRLFARNALDVRHSYDADHFVFSGPILSADFVTVYGNHIHSLLDKGASYSLLSVHASAERDDLSKVRAFLEAYPPRAIHTRDSETYEKVRGIARSDFNGCCFAFFVSTLRSIPKLTSDQPFVCLSFHSMREPQVTLGRPCARRFEETAPRMAHITPSPSLWRVARHFDFLRRHPRQLGSWKIVRPVHGFYPAPHLLFGRPGSYISFNPHNFLAIYKHCDGVVTDRVHAGVAALSFGKPALVARLDGRSAVFDRVRPDWNGPLMTLPAGRVAALYDDVLAWLKSDFAEAIA